MSNFAGLVVRDGSTVSDAKGGFADQLPDRIARAAGAWLDAGLRAGDRVVLVLDASTESVIAYLSALWAGLVVAPVDRDGSKSPASLATAIQAKGWWSPQSVSTAGQEGISISFGEARSIPVEAAARSVDDLAVLAPTSGSTGSPRLVEITHGNLATNTRDIVATQRIGSDDKAMLVLPLHYCFGASVLHSHLLAGGSVMLDHRWMFPDKVLRAMADSGSTSFAGVPTTYTTLLRRSSLDKINLPALRRLLQAGGALPLESQSELRERLPSAGLYVMYGQTEATARLTTLDPEQWPARRGSVGRPLPNVALEIRDEAGTPVPTGDEGEIWAKGPSIARGYWSDPETSASKFQSGWLRTGDLGRMDPDGYLTVTGRLSSFLKIRGIRVAAEEIENLVATIEGVRDCGVCGIPHPEAGEAIAIFAESQLGQDELESMIRRKLPPRWNVAFVRRCETLPRSSSGKLRRNDLRDLAATDG